MYQNLTTDEIAELPKHSSCDKLFAALAKAQGEMMLARKESDNPYFRSKYADLSEVIRASRTALVQNNICVIQSLASSESSSTGLALVTYLGHSSGQCITSMMPILSAKTDPQSLGSAITYARRYTLAAIAGVSIGDDDDGEKAMGRTEEPANSRKKLKISEQERQKLASLIEKDRDAWKVMTENLGICSWDDINPGNYERLYNSLKKRADERKARIEARKEEARAVAK